VLSLPGSICGYLDEILASDYDDFKQYVRLVEVFTLVAVILSILGMIAMSVWYASSNAKTVAIRKVFGSTEAEEVKRISGSFLLHTLISVAIGIPLAVLMVGRFLENYPERISGYWWIFAATTLLSVVIALVSVFWQTLKTARTNPAIELKKE
jgi:putative ABC transport system permease protein